MSNLWKESSSPKFTKHGCLTSRYVPVSDAHTRVQATSLDKFSALLISPESCQSLRYQHTPSSPWYYPSSMLLRLVILLQVPVSDTWHMDMDSDMGMESWPFILDKIFFLKKIAEFDMTPMSGTWLFLCSIDVQFISLSLHSLHHLASGVLFGGPELGLWWLFGQPNIDM